VLIEVADGDLDGLHEIEAVVAMRAGMRVVALLDNETRVTGAIRAGADGVLSVHDETDSLTVAVTSVAAGYGWVSPMMLGSVLRELRASAPPPNEFDERLRLLTAREREVLERMAAGLDHATIARDLVVSVNTVRTHSQRILAKLEVHSGLEAVSVARRAHRNAI
jgi:DNA-binding NarL/FixJ family response regulator